MSTAFAKKVMIEKTASPKLTLVPFHLPSHSLPFVRVGETVDFWHPKGTGDYEHDCMLGRAYAQAFIDYLNEHQDHVIFGSIVRAIAQRGIYDGVEIGFCSRLGFILNGFVSGR